MALLPIPGDHHHHPHHYEPSSPPDLSSSSSEMKKSSYYVLFLGAKESRGLRGPHYIEPVLQYFVSQEARMQALKVTLQVGQKGLRIIPVHHRTTTGIVPLEGTGGSDKHFIPHHAITCVFQAPAPNDDIVSCILLIYNPDTRCPVHVHCYRCDSPETATILKSQLETLVNREDNQRKFRDIESRLQSKGLLVSSTTSTSSSSSLGSPVKPPSSSHNARGGSGTPDFDCRTSDSSDNSDRGFGSASGVSNIPGERIATLYDSLAAELREKLNTRNRNTPILFPPRDYDTVHRQRGNLLGIEARRCSNPAVVGGARSNRRSYASREQDSCGRSSGIGSAEDNCSPIHDPAGTGVGLDSGNVGGVPSSSDDEEWNPNSLVATETTQFLVRPMWVVENNSSSPPNKSSPLPPPLPKRPENRQRSPDHLNHHVSMPPPQLASSSSREKFEGVRQKWEKLDHQYNTKQQQQQNHHQNHQRSSHDSLDDGYRSREAAEADYRRQLSRESLLRSLSRSQKTDRGSRDSLDRWVEAGVRSSRNVWRKHPGGDASLEDVLLPCPDPNGGSGPTSHHPSGHQYTGLRKMQHSSQTAIIPESNNNRHGYGVPGGGRDPGRRPKPGDKQYRELEEQERFPGLDKDTARLVMHGSNHNLSQQHIYSEPSFEPKKDPHQKAKKFSFAFWK